MQKYHLLINGQQCQSDGASFFPAFDPTKGEQVHLITQSTPEDVNNAVAAAKRAATAWGQLRPLFRGRAMHAIAQLIRTNKAHLSSIESLNTGKTKGAADREMDIAAEYFEFFGNLTSQRGGELIDIGDGYHCFNQHEPYGVVGIITPWNLPLNQFARSAAAALAAGNTVVVKPSEHTSASTVELVTLIFQADIVAPGVINVVTGDGKTGSALVGHPDVAKVSSTGSVQTGKSVGALCAGSVKPVTLELGGKSPNIVLADADLDRAVQGCIKGFVSNAGQVCIAGSRIYVHASIYDAFQEKLTAALSRLDQSRESWAPIITKQQYQKVLDFIAAGEKENLPLIYRSDASLVPQQGWFVPRVVFAVTDEDNGISSNEIFGPVAVLRKFESIQECIALANHTNFGLAAGVWGSDISRIHQLVSQIEAGQIFVNDYFAGGVENPLGGYKESGIGKEKGIQAYLNYQRSKNVVIALDPGQ